MKAPVLHEPEAEAKTHTFVLDLDASAKPTQRATATHGAGEYKAHSLAARYWGAIPWCAQPLRQVPPKEAQATFIHGLLDTPTEGAPRNPLDWALSLGIHVAIVAAVVLIPLAFTQVLDMSKLRATFLTLPRPPAAAPAPRPPALAARHAFHALQPSAITMPTIIPKKVVQFKDVAAPDVAVGVEGGVAGGETGGVLGGILGGAQSMPAPPPSAPKKTVYRVGGNIKPPRELLRVAPIYSPIARTAHVEGTVEIDAVIDERGDVVQARAVSGPPLLMPAALQAVVKWKYEPTYLDGVPVSIETKVTVIFHLS